mmetsp:Transcript_17029/g.46119  ORF Transcript_17029/g.46119 Transcript_17029/m.46119 type:complete len:146 (+) Transcript_17029:1211-1648(+)
MAPVSTPILDSSESHRLLSMTSMESRRLKSQDSKDVESLWPNPNFPSMDAAGGGPTLKSTFPPRYAALVAEGQSLVALELDGMLLRPRSEAWVPTEKAAIPWKSPRERSCERSVAGVTDMLGDGEDRDVAGNQLPKAKLPFGARR